MAKCGCDRSTQATQCCRPHPWGNPSRSSNPLLSWGLDIPRCIGEIHVLGAKGIAVAYGIDEFVIGATLVAIGTSAPELATALIAKIRGHDEVGIGTLLGSNIFNGLFIMPVAAMIHPIQLAWGEVALGLTVGLLTTLAIFPVRSNRLGRERGMILIGLYAAYIGLIF